MTAPDFKKILTKKYKVWRILRAPGVWAQAYRDREKILRNYRTAIIFPEQLLGLDQSNIWSVGVTAGSNGGVVSVITPLRNYDISSNHHALRTLEQILENEDQGPHSHNNLIMGGSGGSFSYNSKFMDQYCFSGKDDALKYHATQTRALLGSIS